MHTLQTRHVVGAQTVLTLYDSKRQNSLRYIPARTPADSQNQCPSKTWMHHDLTSTYYAFAYGDQVETK